MRHLLPVPARSKLSVLAVAAASVVTARAWAPQNQTQRPTPPTFRSTTDIVELDVSVTDEAGQPIRGLTAGDFQIAGHTITTFQEVAHGVEHHPEQRLLLRLPRDVSDNQSTRDATLVVLVVDDQVPAKEQEQAKALARRVIDQLGADIRIGLLWTSGRPGVELTEDRPRLLAGIDRRRPAGTARVPRRSRVVTGTCAFTVFEQAARMLAPLTAQRKALVGVSPYCGADVKGAVDSMAYRDDFPLERAAVEMVDVMRRANIAFYGLDPRGAEGYSLSHFPSPFVMGQLHDPPTTPQMDPILEPAREVAASPMRFPWVLRFFDPVVLSQENLVAVAGATGGFAVTNTDDLEGGVRRLVDDFDHYYLIGFPPLASEQSGFHELSVSVDRPGAVLRFRRGFQLEGVRPHGRSSSVLPTITGVMPVSGVALRLMATPFVTDDGRPRELVGIEVEGPRASLAADDGTLTDDVRVTLVAVDTDSSRVEKAFHFDRHVSIQPAAAGTGETVGFQIVRDIDLKPGTYQLRVSVESAKLGSGSVYLTTDVPDDGDAPLSLGGPLLAWAGTGPRPAAATLLDPGLPVVAPLFDRVFRTGETVRLIAPLRQTPAGGGALVGRVELLDEADTPVYSVAAPVSGERKPTIDATVPLSGVGPGAYRLRVTVAGAGLATSREVGIAVR
ncbi:MAG: VWA domain-containing protein [Vicinamibacterales bacterium]